jgi:hypothetical protein
VPYWHQLNGPGEPQGPLHFNEGNREPSVGTPFMASKGGCRGFPACPHPLGRDKLGSYTSPVSAPRLLAEPFL